MHQNNLPVRMVRALMRPGLTVGTIVALALLATACGDSASPITAPALQLSASNGRSVAASNGRSISASNDRSAASSTFTVLANAAVSCTDGSIAGSVGTFLGTPPGAVTQVICPISGSIDIGDKAAKAAFNGFLAQYAALAPVPGNGCTVESGTLAGVTLPPGTYCFPAAATLTGTLTLDGPTNGTWLFTIGTGLGGTGALTGTNFSVVMANGGQPCNVTWWVAQAATMTTSGFQGNILAGAAITITGGPINGNLWAGASGTGDVTTTGSVVTGCAGSTGNGNGNGDGKGNGDDNGHGSKCNQGVGNGAEGCDPGNSNHHNGSNDENGGTPGNPGRKP
jgi:hypothetical protein